MRALQSALATAIIIGVAAGASVARAEIDGHGPDAWRVTGVSANDVLNARMGPGTNYPVIETFAHNERNMQQITCVPFYTAAHYTAMSQAQISTLPPRWCLMRNKAMSKAGWVAQRYITPEGQVSTTSSKAVRTTTNISSKSTTTTTTKPGRDPYTTSPDLDLAIQAQDLVRDVYERQFLSEKSNYPGPLDPAVARNYFTDDFVAWLSSGNIDTHPLYGAQDFDGTIGEPLADPDVPMVRGMVTINVDFINFGHPQRAIFYVRPDTSKAGMPLRIFSVEHDGSSYP